MKPQPKPQPDAAAKTERKQQTFIARAFRIFRQRVTSGLARANDWQRRSDNYVLDGLTAILYEKGKTRRLFWGLAAALWLAFLLLADKWGWGVGEGAWQTFLRESAAGSKWQFSYVALVFTALALMALFLALFGLLLFRKVILTIPVIIRILGYAGAQALVLIAKLFLLLPLAILFAGTRLIQLWRRRFYTCPSRQCAYRGLPIYVCSHCQESNRYLWPNLYGLLKHYCVNCDAKLPTLDSRGRDKLERRCGGCEMPLHGRHTGQAPEHLVAIVGAPGSGKTNYLLMAINEITNNHHHHHPGAAPLRGEIDDHTQAEEFDREWKKLAAGIPADKTSEILKALLLYAKVGSSRRQLYLYDAPGEEFTSISAMTRQQYFHLLEGIVLLVDPLSFEGVRTEAGADRIEVMPLQDVVTSILGWAASGVETGRGGKMKLRVAVVISKADLPGVGKELGANEPAQATSAACRAALVKWGGVNAVNALEHHFESVEYFACSPLGRAVETYNRQPFQGQGILEPLSWVLSNGLTATNKA